MSSRTNCSPTNSLLCCACFTSGRY
jgi:hypothetical protein